MDQVTMALWLAMVAAVALCFFGVFFLVNPTAGHKMNMGITQSIASFDSTFLKHHYYAGASFLVVGVVLLYIILRVLW